jgi:hypothetical protein
MKKKLIIIVLFFIPMILLIVGCQKEKDLIEPSTIITKYTVETSIIGSGGVISPSGKTEVDSGSDLNFKLSPNPGFKSDSIVINNISFPLSGTIYYNIPKINTNYIVKAIFKKTISWYLMNGEWKLDSTLIHELNGTWTHYAIWGVSGETQQTITFLSNGSTSEYWDGKFVGDGPWSIDETKNPPILHRGMTASVPEGDMSIIEKLDGESLILAKYNVPYVGDPTLKGDYKYIYSHVSSKK